MRTEQVSQAHTAQMQDTPRPLDQPRKASELLTIEIINDEALHYRGKHWRRSVYRFLAEKGVNTVRRSRRCVLVKKADLDRALSASPSESQKAR